MVPSIFMLGVDRREDDDRPLRSLQGMDRPNSQFAFAPAYVDAPLAARIRDGTR